jgi:hypothetical protein
MTHVFSNGIFPLHLKTCIDLRIINISTCLKENEKIRLSNFGKVQIFASIFVCFNEKNELIRYNNNKKRFQLE